MPLLNYGLLKQTTGRMWRCLIVPLVAAFLLSTHYPVLGAALYEPERSDFPCKVPVTYEYGKGDCGTYFKWVVTFYRGTWFTTGWTAYASWVLSKIAIPDVRERLTGKFNNLGRTIAAEWAKENGHRAIHTFRPASGEPADLMRGQGFPNMQDLRLRFDEAVAKDGRDGNMIERLLDIAQGVAEKAIRGDVLSDREMVWKEYLPALKPESTP